MDKAWPAWHTAVAVPKPGGGYDVYCNGASGDCFGWEDSSWFFFW